ncbi:MAG: MarR family transcriptional regulator [Chitinophagales bacterium]|nr:MarR family transcriptional regulator [Chitinophagales bacterium]
MGTTKQILTLPKQYSSKYNRNLLMYANLITTASMVDKLANCILKNFDLTHIQFNILKILFGAANNNEQVTPGDISKRLMFASSDLTRLLDRLEKKDLITREVDPTNRRKININITEKGELLVLEYMPIMHQATNNFFEAYISENDREIMIKALEVIQKNVSLTNVKCLETMM